MTRSDVRLIGLVLVGLAAVEAVFAWIMRQPPRASRERAYEAWAATLPAHATASALAVVLLLAAGAVCWWVSRQPGDRRNFAATLWLAGLAVSALTVGVAEWVITRAGSVPQVTAAMVIGVVAVVLRPGTFKA